MRTLIAAALIGISPAAQAAQSIVGTWAYPDGDCATPLDTFAIQPMSLATDALVCEFQTVRREGQRVIWSGGRCSDGSKSWSETVTAVDGEAGLTLQFGSAEPVGPLRSCSRHAAR
jgi:hypothetical protein